MEVMIDNEFKITSVPLNYILEQKVLNKKEEEVWQIRGYFTNLHSLAKGYLKHTMMSSVPQSFKEVLDMEDRLNEAINTISKVAIKGSVS